MKSQGYHNTFVGFQVPSLVYQNSNGFNFIYFFLLIFMHLMHVEDDKYQNYLINITTFPPYKYTLSVTPST